MRVTIHNVGHGLCVSLIHENGNVMLWDCGSSETSKPSEFLKKEGVTKVDRFFVTNYDEDHISDLPSLHQSLYVTILTRNNTIDADQLRQLKLESGPISSAMEFLLEMMRTYTSPVKEYPEFPGVTYKTFYNVYKSEFDDTNNISLVTFLYCNDCCFLIPGDVETTGWRTLLQKHGFKKELEKVNYFIASHHGRESGYCREVFNYCQPMAFIFSDSEVKCATQEMADIYRAHASGTQFNDKTRYVLSTRKDGSILFEIQKALLNQKM